MKRKTLIPIAVVLFLIAVVVLKVLFDRPTSDSRRQNAVAVKVDKARRETVIQRIQITGDVIPIQQASIFSKVSGNLDRVYVNIGARVRTGQLLALIDTTELVQQLQQMSATFYNPRVTYQRTKQLLEGSLVAKQDVDNAEALMKVAEANYENAKTRLGYARITAPFTGTITKRFMEQGGVVTTPTNATLFSLMDYDTVRVVVNILEKDIPLVHVGTLASISVDAFPGKEHRGSVARLSEAIDLETRTMTAEIDIPNPTLVLRPGMYATVILFVAERPNQITIPTQALLRENENFLIYTVQGNAAHRVDVTLGVEQGERTEILSGLQGDKTIIVMGQQLVKDGGLVKVQ